MMKIVEINGGVFGSTGKIMFDIARSARDEGMEVMCCSPITVTNRHQEPDEEYIKIGTFLSRRVSVLLSIITGFNGCFAIIPTLKLLKKIDKFKPDVIHIHTLHNSYINFPLLFMYIKIKKIKTIWTLHDCWAFTGHCTHFIYEKCEQWKSECRVCPKYKEYPKSFFDQSRTMWNIKKKCFTGVEDMTIVVPSLWLSKLVLQSFLKQYPTMVVNNGVDLSVFKPTKSHFREKYKLTDKIIVLGVSFSWGIKKGIDVFTELSKRLDEKYQIVLVGTDDNIEINLPKEIISIYRTQSQQELAEIYSAANVFVNPTREENYPTVNMEAQACGTPVITFDTGGCSETVIESYGSRVVECDNIDKIYEAIVDICENSDEKDDKYKNFKRRFDARERIKEYVKLYESKNI